jgi:hypothetical protein
MKILGGVVDSKEFDHFHGLIVMQEIARSGYRGFQDGLSFPFCSRVSMQFLILGRKSWRHNHRPYGSDELGRR